MSLGLQELVLVHPRSALASAVRLGLLPSDPRAWGQGCSLLLPCTLPGTPSLPLHSQIPPTPEDLAGVLGGPSSGQSLGIQALGICLRGETQFCVWATRFPLWGPASSHHLLEACSSLRGLFTLRCE